MAKSPLSKRPKTSMELPREDRDSDPSPDQEWDREKFLNLWVRAQQHRDHDNNHVT